MRVVSLFSGIGGIDIAFQQLGHQIVWANDIDKYACQTYRYNFKKTNIIQSDIRDVDKDSIPDCDIVVAGFPCQPFSVCGEQKGFSDERGNLFFEIGKVLDKKLPQIVFLENVANLTRHDSGKTFNVIHNELVSRGYYIRYIIADACNYGIPQHRTRTYILAFLDYETCQKYDFPKQELLDKRITDVIHVDRMVNGKYYYKTVDKHYFRLKEFINDELQLYRYSDYGIQQSKDGISFTLKANMGTYCNRIPIIKDRFGIRKIMPEECLALQGFESDFMFPESVPEKERYKQAGNTVCVPLIKKIIQNLE